jgi:hypothetical protein
LTHSEFCQKSTDHQWLHLTAAALVFFSAKGAELISSLGHRPRISGIQNVSAEGATHSI